MTHDDSKLNNVIGELMNEPDASTYNTQYIIQNSYYEDEPHNSQSIKISNRDVAFIIHEKIMNYINQQKLELLNVKGYSGYDLMEFLHFHDSTFEL